MTDRQRHTNTRCGACGEHLYGYERKIGTGVWTLKCGCGPRVVSTTWEWIEAEFCKPFDGAGTGERAPIVKAKA